MTRLRFSVHLLITWLDGLFRTPEERLEMAKAIVAQRQHPEYRYIVKERER
jgi:hypothetical protein